MLSRNRWLGVRLKKSTEYFNCKNKILNFLNKNKITITSLLLLTFIVSAITYYRILVQMEIGPISDSFDFLSNALVFAGQGMGYSDLSRPPVFSFIISLLFRMGYTSASVIFFVDGMMFVFGVIGLFLIFKLYFKNLESFIGALLYATFPIILTTLGVGFSDLTSVSFTIWTIYFLILACNRNSRFFYLVFPFAMLSFLSRYNNALIIFPILIYLILNKQKLNPKNLIIGLCAGLLTIIPVLIFFYRQFGSFLTPFISFEKTSTGVTSNPQNFAYDPNIFYYIQHFPSLVGPQGILIGIILVFFVFSYVFLKFRKSLYKQFIENLRINKVLFNSRIALFALFLIIFLGTFGKIFYMYTELLFLILMIQIYDLTKKLCIKNLKLHILFFSWFMAFFIFHSIFVTKDLRYFILMAPPVAYFMMLALSQISKKINIQFKDINIIFPFIVTLLTVIILISTIFQIPTILESNEDKIITNQQMIQSSQWFENYDPNYKNQNIYSDLWPNISWYLKTNVKMVPVFKDNQTYNGGVKNYSFNQTDSNQYNNYLVNNNAEFYICLRSGLNLTSYTQIKQFGNVIIYQRTS